MSDPRPQTSTGQVAAAISNDVVRVLHDQTGRGPTQARTTINGELIVCVLHDTLTTGERTLVDAGHEQTVLETRKLYQMAMRRQLVGIIETHTGREVVAFMSDNHIDPDAAVEVFLLAPQGQ
jgi:uncharacterized protein YbcI